MKKISSFSHGEFDTEDIIDEKKIKEKIKNSEDIFNRGFKLKNIAIDSSLPDYITHNKDRLKNWIV